MFSVFYLSINYPIASEFINKATSNRNVIWDQVVLNLSWNNFLLGDIVSSTVEIYWSDKLTNNPHNAFLFIATRIGIVSLIFFVCVIIVKIKKRSIEKKLLLMAFLAAGISSSNIVYIGNPFYLYMLYFCLTKSQDELKVH
jgi:hypothetical protein